MYMNTGKVLVIGGAGYIGGKTVDHLRGHTGCLSGSTFIFGGDNTRVDVYDNLLYEDRYMKDVKFYFGNVCDTQKILSIIKQDKYDSVVLLAALVGDAACNINPQLTEEINYKAVKDLCKQLDPDIHLVFTSTCSVYGANEEVVNEDSITKPLSSYASTKLRAEKHVLDRGGTIFRLGTVFGLGDQFSRIRADLVVNTLTIKAFCTGEITVNGGNQWRPIISVSDIAGYIEEACMRKKEVSGLYNIAYKNVKISDIADDIFLEFPTVKINRLDQMFQDERNYKVSVDKANNIFWYKPQVSAFEEIHNLHSLLKQNRIKDPTNINYHNGMFLSHKRI